MGLDGARLVVSASSQFMLDWVSSNYGDRIRSLAGAGEQRSPVEIMWRVMRPPARQAA
jgi:chromosomal replication initiation ATPase DnaA